MKISHIGRLTRRGLLAVAAAAFLAAPNPAGAVEDPEYISIGVIPFEEIQLTAEKFQGVVTAIEEATGKRVEWHFPTSYASLIEAMRRGFVHIGYFGPASYIAAVDASDGQIEAFAQAMWGGGHYREAQPGYQSFIIVKADSPYESVEELRGMTLALTDPASTSGELVPKVQLGKELGERLDEYFGSTFYAGGHTAAALAVLEGRADAATVADVTLDWGVDAGSFGTEDFRIIWRSSLLPLDPFAWRADLLSDDLKDQIRSALLNLHETDYGQEFLRQTRSTTVEPADDAAFDGIREIETERGDWE
jgi:phosphonate transport system substrate-binding protein